jgi:hypothetical protein
MKLKNMKLFESKNTGDVRLFISPNLTNILKEIKHEIAFRLLSTNNSEELFDVSLLDVHKRESDMISFESSTKMLGLFFDKNLMRERDPEKKRPFFDKINKAHLHTKTSAFKNIKGEAKIGKFIRRLFGNEFPNNLPKNASKPDVPNDIESFVNMYF